MSLEDQRRFEKYLPTASNRIVVTHTLQLRYRWHMLDGSRGDHFWQPMAKLDYHAPRTDITLDRLLCLLNPGNKAKSLFENQKLNRAWRTGESCCS
jgi:hypothetical protein